VSESFELPVPPRLKKWFEDNVNPWLGAVFLAGLLHWGVNAAMRLHWILGLILTLVLALVLMALLAGWRQQLYKKYSWPMAGALLLVTTVVALVVFSAISSLIYRLDVGAYSGLPTITNDGFFNFYFWHTVDALPGLDLWGVYGAPPPPIHQHGFLAGSTLLCFRAVVLTIILASLKDWFTRSRKVGAA